MENEESDDSWGVWRWVAAGLVLLSFVMLAALADDQVRAWVQDVLQWIENFGPWGPVLFIVLQAAIVVFLLPGIVFTVSAGFLFGLPLGLLVILLGTLTGALIAFVTGRFFFSDSFTNYLLGHRKLRLLHAEFAGDGWKLVLLTRLVPFFPFKLSNYFFGVANFRLRDFLLGTAIGILPFTFTNVYAGSLAADVADVGGTGDIGAGKLVAGVVGLVASVVTVALITHHARRALQRAEDSAEQQTGDK